MKILVGAICTALTAGVDVPSLSQYAVEIRGNDAVQIYESMRASEGSFVKRDGEKAKVFVYDERAGDAIVRTRLEVTCNRPVSRCVLSGHTLIFLPHEDD